MTTKHKPYYRKAPTHERLNQLRAAETDFVGSLLYEAAKSVVAGGSEKDGLGNVLVANADFETLAAAVRLTEKKIAKDRK